jgi:hypothetical protein
MFEVIYIIYILTIPISLVLAAYLRGWKGFLWALFLGPIGFLLSLFIVKKKK